MKKYALLGVLLLALLVRLVLLNQSFWLDEAAQALESSRPMHQQLDIPADFQPPLFHITLHFFTVFGSSEVWLRLVSVFAGLVTVGATYLVCVTVWKGKLGTQIGLLSALLLSLSSLHVFYSQELRPYAFAAMWATLSWLMLLKYVDGHKHKFLRVFVLFSAAGLYSMYVYPFVFLSQLVYVWFFAPTLRKSFMIAAGVVALLFAPWIPSFLEQLRIGSELRVTLPGWSQVVSSPQWKALPLIWSKFVGGQQNVDANLGSVLYFGIPSLLILVSAFLLYKQRKAVRQLQPMVMWLVVTVLTAWMISFIVPVLSVKRALIALPAFYICIAVAFVHLERKWRTLVIASVVLFQCIGLWSYWTTPALQREDWRAIHGEIYDNYSADSTIVVFAFDAPFAPWNWYDRKEKFALDTLAFPSFPLKEPEFSLVMEKVMPYKKVLVFDYLRDLTDPDRRIDAWLMSHGYASGAILNTRNVGFVREYRKLDFVSLK